jgi:hypothetical protein
MVLPDLRTDYTGRQGPMFRLALKTGVLTVLTLGMYRFWMKTRMRRYYWSSIRPGGVPLEYAGRGSEKLLGFLTAVVVLAFYIGVVNLALMFFSFSLFEGNSPAYLLSFLGLMPMYFFAQYRARRYVLARTRWRGIRFGMAPGVRGYIWRAAVHWGVTLVTLGILWPRMTFALEKYRTDRTFYGDHVFEQQGRWWQLMGAMKHVYLGVGLIVAGWVAVAVSGEPVWSLAAVMGGLWTAIGLAYWKAESFRRLTGWKKLGPVGLRARPRAGRIIGIYLGGALAIAAILTAAISAMLMALGLVVAVMDPEVVQAGFEDFADLAAIPAWIFTLLGVVAYFSLFLLWGVLKEVFITLPLARHFAEVTEVTGVEGLAAVRQRPRDEFVEAEGFADALPLGGGL